MALVNCRECGKQVSTEAVTCPNCGIANPAPPPRKPNVGRGRFILFAIGFLIVLGLVQALTGEKKPTASVQSTSSTAASITSAATTVSRPPADPKREAAFQKAVALARAVKATANDPDSIEIFSAMYFDDGTVAIEYRGRNAFNAKVVNRAVHTGDGKAAAGSDKEVAALWNKYVAKKPGYDLTSSMRGAGTLGAY